MKKLYILLIFVVHFPSLIFASQIHSEKYYQDIFCNQKNGKSEVVMDDRTRCDCVFTENNITYSVEVDFAKKRYQAVGQALHYSRMSNSHAGILLIIESDKDIKYLNSMIKDIQYHNLKIQVFTICPTKCNVQCQEYRYYQPIKKVE